MDSESSQQIIFEITYIQKEILEENVTNRVRIIMMASSNENVFRVTGPLRGEFTGRRGIPLTKASDAELWCVLWFTPEQTVE